MTQIAVLTTTDNPYDPLDDFERWFEFDSSKGYNSCGLLARLAHTSDELSDEDNCRIVEDAIDRIVDLNLNGLYTKRVYNNEEDK